jgi:hypothetical protein
MAEIVRDKTENQEVRVLAEHILVRDPHVSRNFRKRARAA